MIILQINNVHYRRGGADVVYFNTAELLEKNGHQVVFFNRKMNNNIFCKDEIHFVSSVESRSKSIWSVLLELRNFFYNPEAKKNIENLILELKPDIAHVHLLWGGGISPSIISVLKKYKIPLVQTVHDYRMICPVALLKDSNGAICEKCEGKYFYWCAIKRCSKKKFFNSVVMASEMYFHNAFFNPIKKIDGFIFVSDFSKKKHLQYKPKLAKVFNSVIYNYSPNVEGSYIKKTNGGYYLYYGRISSEKGILTLIDAFRSFPTQNLKIVGTGPEWPTLKKYVDENLLNNIEFLGYKSGEELVRIIINSNFVIVPSECYENNPMTIVEAFSLSVPVICSKIGGIPELIEEGKSGFQFSSGQVNELIDSIKKTLFLSDDEYLNMSDCAKVFARENFSEQIHYSKLLEFYNNVLINYNEN